LVVDGGMSSGRRSDGDSFDRDDSPAFMSEPEDDISLFFLYFLVYIQSCGFDFAGFLCKLFVPGVGCTFLKKSFFNFHFKLHI